MAFLVEWMWYITMSRKIDGHTCIVPMKSLYGGTEILWERGENGQSRRNYGASC